MHKIKEDSRKIGEILEPMKYKMVIGPGSEETWKSTGDALNDMYSKELMSTFVKYDVPVISGMPLHRRLKAEEYKFQAWPVDMEPFPAYLAATIELTMQLATLKDAMHCIQTPTASGKIAAHPAAKVLRNKETITTSHKEEIKNFMQTRDKKIRISKLPDNTTVDSPCLDIDTYLCEQIDIKRKSKRAYEALHIYFRERIRDWAHVSSGKQYPATSKCLETCTDVTPKKLPDYYDTAICTTETVPYVSSNTQMKCIKGCSGLEEVEEDMLTAAPPLVV